MKMPKLRPDVNLPAGWLVSWVRIPIFSTPEGRTLRGRGNAMQELYTHKLPQKYLNYVRKDVEREGWKRSNLLPPNWYYKRYRHTIQGLPKDALVLLAPNGFKYRSKKKILMDFSGFSSLEIQKLNEFFEGKCKDLSKAEGDSVHWSTDTEIVPPLWKYRCYSYYSKIRQREEKVHYYMTPEGTVLQGERLVRNYLYDNGLYNSLINKFSLFKPATVKPKKSASIGSRQLTVTIHEFCEWKAFEYPTLAGWMFRLSSSQVGYEYKSPCGKVFGSRGSTLRFLMNEVGLSYSKILVLKKLMKNCNFRTNTRENDRYVKSLPVSQNFLIFIQNRYKNSKVQETTDPSLPAKWGKKIINGVEYIRSSDGNVYNSRKLATDAMKRSGGEDTWFQIEFTATEIIRVAMEDSDSESELSDSEDEFTPASPPAAIKLETEDGSEDEDLRSKEHKDGELGSIELKDGELRGDERKDGDLDEGLDLNYEEEERKPESPDICIEPVREVGRRKRCSNDSGQEHPDTRSESSLSNDAETKRVAADPKQPLGDPIKPWEIGNSYVNDGTINQKRSLKRKGGKASSKKSLGRSKKTTPSVATPSEEYHEIVLKGFHEFLRKNANI